MGQAYYTGQNQTMDQTAAEQPAGKVWRYSDGDKLTSMNSRFIVNMCYTNRTSKLVDVFWINFEGREVNYGQVKPGATTLLYTYLTHPWVFRYAGGDETVLLVNGKPVAWPSQDNTYADISEAPRLRWSPATHVSDFRRRAPDFARDVQNLLLAYFAQQKPGSRRRSVGGDRARGSHSPAKASTKAGACPSPAGALSSCCGGKLWQWRGAGQEAPRALEAAFAEQCISAPPQPVQIVPASVFSLLSGPSSSSSSSSKCASPPLRRSSCEGHQQQQQQQQSAQPEPHSASQGLLGQLPYDILLEIIAHMAPPLQEEHPILKDDVEMLPRGVRPQRGPVAQLATVLLGPVAPPPPDVPPEVWFEAAAVAAGAEGAAAAPVPEPAGADPAPDAAAGAVNGAAADGPLAQGALGQQNAPWGGGGGGLQQQQPQQQQQQQHPPGVDPAERAAQVAAVMLYTDAVALANAALLHVDRMLQFQEAQVGVLLAPIMAAHAAAAAAAQGAEANGREEQQEQEQAAEVAGPEQGQQQEEQQQQEGNGPQ